MLFGDLVKYRAPFKGAFEGLFYIDVGMIEATWMLFGGLVSRLSSGPYGASYGLFWGLVGDTKLTH